MIREIYLDTRSDVPYIARLDNAISGQHIDCYCLLGVIAGAHGAYLQHNVYIPFDIPHTLAWFTSLFSIYWG